MLALYALFLVPISAFTRALAGMWVFNWFAPVVYPGAHASYLQALAAMCILSGAVAFYKTAPPPNAQDTKKDVAVKLTLNALVQPFVFAALLGIVYLCCIFPFKG